MKNALQIMGTRSSCVNPTDLTPLVITKFNEDTVQKFAEYVQKLNSDDSIQIIPIIIDSYGGNVHSLLAMLDIMASATKPFATVALGKAMSCGAILLAFGTRGYRYSGANADIMIHQVSAGTFGKIEEMKVDVKHTNSLNLRVYKMLAKQCGHKDAKFFLKLFKEAGNMDIHLTAKEAKRLNLLDKVGIPTFLKG